MANIVGDNVIFHNSIASGISVIGYAATVSIDRAVSKREAFSGLEVNAISTTIGDCHVFDLHIRRNSIKPISAGIRDCKSVYCDI